MRHDKATGLSLQKKLNLIKILSKKGNKKSLCNGNRGLKAKNNYLINSS